MSPRSLQDIFKTPWKTKNCYAEDMLKTSSRRLEDKQMFAGLALDCQSLTKTLRKRDDDKSGSNVEISRQVNKNGKSQITFLEVKYGNSDWEYL